MKPAKHQYTILKQICQHIPAHLVSKLARFFGIDKQTRSFSPWSHVIAMLHVQIAHSLSLNDVADTLRNHSGGLTTIQLSPYLQAEKLEFLRSIWYSIGKEA